MSLRWIVLLVLLLAGCASHLPVREPVHEAELAMQAGARLFEAGDPGAGTELRRALELEPGWVAPQRMLDELARSELRLPEVLAMRRVDATSAGGLYLRARLEGDDGERYYRRALELDPACAFAHHGLGVLAARAGRPALAEQCAKRAWQHARGQWERGFFALALVRTIQRVRGPRAGCEAIAGMLRTSDFSRVDRLRLETQLVLWRALIGEPDALLEDALRLARDPAISDVDLRLLASGLPMRADAELEWMIALGSSPGAVREELRAQLELARAPGALALARHASAQPPPRALLFALDRGREAVESWLAGLPPQVLDAQGLPRDPRLVRVVQLVRAGAGRELGAALLECGWFSEARAFANTLARSDLPAALELDDRALAGQARVTQLVRIARSSESLEEALGRLGLEASPRLEFGPLGTLVHPGPRFSTLDEREGLGRADAPVPGLAAELDALGRFALLGEVIIQKGVDGVVLPRLLVEQTGGSVLGRPWQGTVAWCEGQELSPRAVQFGGHIHAAALHEGFWLDVASVRREREEWVTLAKRFEEPGLRARALAVAALPADGAPDAIHPALDAADRLRLAVIAERGVPTLEEFIEATAVHEAAHVVDRQRFLPLHSGWPRALRLLADCGFSPRMFGEELEARAQLAALCEAREPRILLAHLLEAAGGEFGKQMPHALGYQRLLARLLKRCNGHPGLDPSRLLVQQLHRLSVQDLRALSRAQAGAMGLDRP